MEWLWRHKFRRTTLWLLLSVGLLAGIGWAHTAHHVAGVWCWLLFTATLLSLRRRTLLCCVVITTFGFILGWWHGANYLQQLAPYKSLQGTRQTVVVRALNDALYDKHHQLAFDASEVTLEDGVQLKGKIQVSGFGENAVFQNDEVVVTGKLRAGYGAYQGQLGFAQLQVTTHHPTLASAVRQRFTAGMQTALPEPLAPFAMGLLVGQRATLPDINKQDLLMVGLTHIIAVSGYNLTIILHASKRVLGRRSKRMSTFLSLALIGTFLLITGASASIVRAAIVSMLSIVTTYYGRTMPALNIIAFVAAITAWANPVYVWSDLSWYLSFLAFYGVMILSPLVQARWPGRWHETIIGAVALESVCAEIMSLPFVLHIFGQMSLIGLPANIVVVTLVPLAMLLGFIAGLMGMLYAPLAGWLSWPAALLLNYMLDIAHVLARLPHIFIQNHTLPTAAMLGCYGMIICFTGILWHKTKSVGFGIITDIHESNERGFSR